LLHHHQRRQQHHQLGTRRLYQIEHLEKPGLGQGSISPGLGRLVGGGRQSHLQRRQAQRRHSSQRDKLQTIGQAHNEHCSYQHSKMQENEISSHSGHSEEWEQLGGGPRNGNRGHQDEHDGTDADGKKGGKSTWIGLIYCLVAAAADSLTRCFHLCPLYLLRLSLGRPPRLTSRFIARLLRGSVARRMPILSRRSMHW
jgi:hypothetical protein